MIVQENLFVLTIVLKFHSRPSFDTLEIWLNTLYQYWSNDDQVPETIEENIRKFKAQSTAEISVSNEKVNAAEELDGDEVKVKPTGKCEPLMINPRDILKSPHLLTDFSPTGERIKDSKRAKRHQRKLTEEKKLETPSSGSLCFDDTSESEPMSLLGIEIKENTNAEETLQKVKSHLMDFVADVHEKTNTNKKEKGFMIKISDGKINLNNVKYLEHISDIDSSFDVSSLNNTDNSIVLEESDIGSGTVTKIPSPVVPNGGKVQIETSKNASGKPPINASSKLNAQKRTATKMPTADIRKQNMQKLAIPIASVEKKKLIVSDTKLPTKRFVSRDTKIISNNKCSPIPAKIEPSDKNEVKKVHISKRMTESSRNKIIKVSSK